MKYRLLAKLSILSFLLILLQLFSGCTTSLGFINSEEAIIESKSEKKKGNAGCNNVNHYISDSLHGDREIVRTVKVNVHFMNLTDSSINFSQEEGTAYAKTLIFQSNNTWADNKQMKLPLGNNTPVLPTRIRIKLEPDPKLPGDDGIYFHYNDTLGIYNSADQRGTLFTREHFSRYGRQKGEVMNIFLMESHADSLVSNTYNKSNHGVGYPDWLKVIGGFKNSKEFFISEGDTFYLGAWNLTRLLNHELGHSFGLSHPWKYNDGCDDTPKNPNCWNYSDSGPCDSLVSNNLMDYNAYQRAVTPCQIGIMHHKFSKPNSSSREKLVKDYCYRDSTYDLTLKSEDTIQINKYHDLYGNLTLGENTVVMVNCDLQMPAESKILLKKGSQLILNGAKLYNACELPWKGIETIKGTASSGQVILIGNSSVEHAKSWNNTEKL